MSIESTIRDYLMLHAPLTALIATRMYYLKAPQEVIKPYVVYSTLDDANTKMLVGSDGANPVITFRIVATTAASIIAISEAIRDRINDYTGLITATDIYIIDCVNIRDIPPDADTDNLERFADYQISYERT